MHETTKTQNAFATPIALCTQKVGFFNFFRMEDRSQASCAWLVTLSQTSCGNGILAQRNQIFDVHHVSRWRSSAV